LSDYKQACLPETMKISGNEPVYNKISFNLSKSPSGADDLINNIRRKKNLCRRLKGKSNIFTVGKLEFME